MKKAKLFTALLLTAVMLLSLVGCGSASSGTETAQSTASTATASDSAASDSSASTAETAATTETTESEDRTTTLNVAIISDPGGFDPFSTADFQLRFLVYECLFGYDYDNNYVMQAVDSWEIAEDRMSITAHIPDLYTFEGYQITASDIIWCIDQVLAGNNKRFATMFDTAASYAVDDHTVYLALTSEWLDFNYDSMCHIPVTSQEAYEASADHFYSDGMGGTGPYMVESYTEGNEVVLVPNPDYDRTTEIWGAQNLDRIVCKVVPESSQRTIELESGSIDFITNVGSSDYSYLSSLDYADTYMEALNKNIVMLFAAGKTTSPVSSTLVRQAIAYAIDSEAICNQALQGLKIPATGVTNPICTDWDESMNSNDYYNINTDKAKELLAEAGYADGFSLTLVYSEANGETHKLMAQIIQAELSEIGISVTLTPYDSSTFSTLTGNCDGDWDMALTVYKITGTPLFHFWNLCNENKKEPHGWHNDEFQAMLDEAIYTQDETLIQEMVSIYEEELPYYVIAYDTSLFCVRSGIENVDFKGDNWYFPSDWNYDNCDWIAD